MTEIGCTISLLLKIILVVVSADAVIAACQPASREYQMHQGNIVAFYPSPLQDHVLKDIIYQKRNASSDVVCAGHCLQDDSCKSFNFCKDKLCQLKAAIFSGEGFEVQPSTGCRHYGDEELQTELSVAAAPVVTQLPCPRNYTTEPMWTRVEEPLDLPMRLEFSVQGPGKVYLTFSPGTKGYKHAKFSLGLFPSSFTIFKREDDDSWTTVKTKSNLNVFGETMFVTYNGSHIEAGVSDVETSSVTLDLPSLSQADRIFILLQNTISTEWSFSEPCTRFILTWLGEATT